MKSQDDVRKAVSTFYAASVNKGCGCGCGPTLQKGVAAQHAGYSPEELAALPPDAVANSFGCGNPLAYGQVRAGQTVLDLGSGAGIDLLLAASKVGPGGRVIGVDMTDDMIARARENIARAGLSNVEVRKGIIEELPVESGTVDWVISNCVINLSPEKEKVFAEIARVLKPGGRFSISDIVVKDLPEALRTSALLYASCVAGAISEEAYLAGLRAAGLQDVEVIDRIVYDTPQLDSFIQSDFPAEAFSCCSGAGATTSVAATLAGKIWSAKVTGRKA